LFLDYLLSDDDAVAILDRARPGRGLYAPSFLAAYAAAGLIATRPGPWLLLAADGEAAGRLSGDLAVFLDREVPVMPPRGVPWGSDLAPVPHVCGARQQALLALARGTVVVAEIGAALERFPAPSLLPAPLELIRGAELPFEQALGRLAASGYERVDHVHERGQFAVRGGLLDVYPATGEPVRAELWGDVVDSLRRFSVFSQRTIEPVERVVVYAAGEIDARSPAYRRNLERLAGESATVPEAGMDSQDERQRRASLRAVEALSQRFVTLAQTAGDACLLVVDADDVARQLADAGAGVLPTEADRRERFYESPAAIREWLRAAVAIETIRHDQPERLDAARPHIAARDLNAAEGDLGRLVRDGYRVFVVFRHAGEAGRAAYRLKSLEAQVLEWPVLVAPQGSRGPAPDDAASHQPAPQEPGLYFVAAPLRDGFVSAHLKLAVIPERALLRAARQEPRFVGGARLSSFFDLRLGDYVVHEDYGIARFSGIETKTVAGVTRDYLFLQFKGEDKVYLPHDQMGKVSRYIGAGAGAPALNSLGGTAWQAVRTRARHAVLEMAGELLTLYAARQAQPGFAFGPDGELLMRLEDAFPFDETVDQAAAIDDVKNDMEATWPMDRLVCGDVGYGKTEVAIRAALKAAEAGKQTLVLVPTTILAQQHLATFSERFKDLPVRTAMVSRFRTASETRRILKDFHEGRVDILIGTHRLLSRDVTPHDLGLVIVDEEQRFGVRQKELLRQLKLQVDVMSLSATPIPRTLQMSLSGIRDISVIETPPRGRHEIRTYIGEYRDDIARLAIEKELAREGQAFYLHNRVETIEEAAAQVRQLAPRARVLVAHGQMHEHDLEKVMSTFLAGDADVLVTTSIIESGIDIPTVNTLIADRADMLGLAQLYQIRGRIGRSDEHAYAYLLYPSEGHLSGEAVARLRTLSDHTELGAGFRIAMADLEIRGAGNLLGDEQSGHVAAIGFELYVQMLEEAVGELRGQPLPQERAVRVEIPVSAYVPADYIAWEATKIDVHRRLARARDERELVTLGEELADRFGPPPGPVVDLLALQAVRLKAAAAGATAVGWRSGRLSVDGLELADEEAARLRQLNDRAVHLKARAALAVHPPADLAAALAASPRRRAAASTAPAAGAAADALSAPGSATHKAPAPLLAWVLTVLDAILAARSANAAVPEKGI
jgi:transcription-repair coupling factor (superfamily II helicase)